LLAIRPVDTVDPASAVGQFIATASALNPRRPLREQVDLAMRTPPSHRISQTTSLVTSAPGRSHALLRREFYRLLALPEPAESVDAAVLPIPRIRRRRISAMAVEMDLDLDIASSTLTARLARYPAGSVVHGRPPRVGTHLVVSTDEPHRVLLEAAEIIVHDQHTASSAWLPAVLRELPGAWLATLPVTSREWRVGDRDGTVVSFTSDDEFDGSAWASVAHGWLCAGHSLADLPADVRISAEALTYRAKVRLVS
jgi:hypothetical protein